MKTKLMVLVAIFQLTSCAPTLYDHFTFTETLETKIQTATLIEKSDSPYADNTEAVETLKNQLQKMVLYERSKAKNPINIKMWETLNGENSSIHKFLTLWEEKGTLSPTFGKEFGNQANEVFDLMIEYETKKDKASQNALTELINSL